MSKSKGNGVNPDDMVAKYGADVCRMFMLFKAPPEKVLDWDEQSVQGMARWVNRLNVLVNGFTEGAKGLDVGESKDRLGGFTKLGKVIDYENDGELLLLTKSNKIDGMNKFKQLFGRDMTSEEEDLMSMTAISVQEVSHAMESRQFNVAIAKLMTLSNHLFDFTQEKNVEQSSVEWAMSSAKLNSPIFRESLTTLFRLLHPIAPHFTSESFVRMQNAFGKIDYAPGSVNDQPFNNIDNYDKTHNISNLSWPVMDMTWSQQKAIATVQLNGKLLFTLDTARDILEKSEGEILGELLKIDDFKHNLAKKIQPGKSQILDPFLANGFSGINDEILTKGFKRVITKSAPQADKVLVNFVL
jgi:leucyl-tRNA synthetase